MYDVELTRFTLVFNRRKKLNASGKGSIEIAGLLKKKRKYFATGIYIYPEQWDNKRKMIKGNTLEIDLLNRQIEDKIREFKEIERRFLLKGIEFDLNILSKAGKETAYFNDFFLSEIKNRKDIRETTKRSVMVAYHSFEQFAGKITFNKLTYKLISDYDIWLRNKGFSDHTVRTRHKILKTYINIAIKKGLMDANDYPYRNFKIKDAKSNRIDLSFDEIEKLEQLELPDELEYTRDLFLFSCYTGLRFEDVIFLQKEHLKRQTDGTFEIRKKIIKTGDEIRLPVSYLFSGKALGIIEKYLEKSENEYIFKKISNQYINRNLKALAIVIGYKKSLSFHVARHTFGSRLAELKPDPYLIKELMGHKDIKTSMIYIKTSSTVLTNKVKDIFKK